MKRNEMKWKEMKRQEKTKKEIKWQEIKVKEKVHGAEEK